MKETSPITHEWLYEPTDNLEIPTANIANAAFFDTELEAKTVKHYLQKYQNYPNAFIFPITVISVITYAANWTEAYKLLEGVK